MQCDLNMNMPAAVPLPVMYVFSSIIQHCTPSYGIGVSMQCGCRKLWRGCCRGLRACMLSPIRRFTTRSSLASPSAPMLRLLNASHGCQRTPALCTPCQPLQQSPPPCTSSACPDPPAEHRLYTDSASPAWHHHCTKWAHLLWLHQVTAS